MKAREKKNQNARQLEHHGGPGKENPSRMMDDRKSQPLKSWRVHVHESQKQNLLSINLLYLDCWRGFMRFDWLVHVCM